MAAIAIATACTVARAVQRPYAFDFQGLWRASQAIVAGRNPYPLANAAQLIRTGNPFVVPPLLALVLAPLAHLPFLDAAVIWNAICGLAFIAALWVCGVRDRRVFAVALCSFPTVSSILLGQPTGLFALGLALIWRHRDSWPSALLVALLIAAKWFAWPLVLWFALRGRPKLAVGAAAGAGVVLLLSWAAIGWRGLLQYPRLFVANSAAAVRTDSVSALVLRLGGSHLTAALMSVTLTLGVVGVLLKRSPGDDVNTFTAAIFAGTMLSPIVWQHYLVLLFVPLAIRRPRLDWVWLAVALYWLSPGEPPRLVAQIALVLVTATITMLAPFAGSPVQA